ncbi:MAG: hypothetical protein M3P70_03215 [Actinomycetota bacterium]|nr:hypothetical protein [Actinomycetota bacterium]
MSDQPQPQRETARVALLRWVEPLDAWIRWIVGEIVATGRPLGESALDEAYRRLLAEKGLSDEEFSITKDIGGSLDEDHQGQSLVLQRLRECSGVNALAAGQSIDFNPKMTVVFGENASGKSGYVRILKRLADVRSAEPILGNVYGSASRTAPSAEVEYVFAGEARSLQWRDEQGVAPFTRMGVFDSRAMSIHVDTDLTYVFTPADLALFTHVHAAVDVVRDRAEAASQEARPRANPYLPRFQRGTAVYQQIEALGASTEVASLEALAQVPVDIDEELTRRRARVEALRPETVAARLELARSDRQLFQALSDLCDVSTKFDVERYAGAIEEAVSAELDYGRITEAFLAGHGVDGPPEAWENFVRAGEAVLRGLGGRDVPHAGDDCIYCQQALDDHAAARIHTYREWMNDESARRRDRAHRAAAELAAPLQSLNLAPLAERLTAKSAASSAPPRPLFAAAAAAIGALTDAADALASRRAVDWSEVEQRLVSLQPLSAHALSEAAGIVETLEAQEAERLRAFTAERASLAELEAAATLAALLRDVRAYVERARWADRLTTVLRPIPGVLRSLTEAAKSASDEFLNRGFERQFESEREALRAPQVRLDFPGRRGQAARRKVLVADHRLSEILSEGEQKVIALADFLAESSLRTSPAPLVFDDPVNSLDYKRLEYVVDRLVELAKQHQVIVFTHNIWFAVELLNRYEGAPADCSYFDVGRSDTEVGVVSGGSHPRSDTVKRLKAEINTLVQDAGTMTGESQAALIERAYDKMRAWCEVVVEEEVLQGVTKRYQPNVQMTKIAKIRPDRLDDVSKALSEIFDKSCRVMGGHSQPLETLAVRPSLDEVKKDWQEAQEARERYLAD